MIFRIIISGIQGVPKLDTFDIMDPLTLEEFKASNVAFCKTNCNNEIIWTRMTFVATFGLNYTHKDLLKDRPFFILNHER